MNIFSHAPFKILLGSTFLIISGSAAVSASPSVASAYNDLISRCTASYEEDGYTLLDLNQDGIPELFLINHIASGRFLTKQADVYTCSESSGSYEPVLVTSYFDALAMYAPEDGNGFLTSTLVPANGQMDFYRHIFTNGQIEDMSYSEYSGTMGYDNTNAFIDRNPPFSIIPFTELIQEQDIVPPASAAQQEPAEEDSWDAVEVADTEDTAAEIPADTAVSGLVAGLSEYDLETILAYGPQELSSYFDDRCAHQLLNQVAQSGRVETGSYNYKATINLNLMNSFANAYGDYNYANGNFNIIQRGQYICYALAQLNFTASVSNIRVESSDGSYALVYDYYCHKSDPGVSDTTTNCQKRARLTPLGNGTYRIASIEIIG